MNALVKYLSEKFSDLPASSTAAEADVFALKMIQEGKLTLAEYSKATIPVAVRESDDSDPMARIAAMVKTTVEAAMSTSTAKAAADLEAKASAEAAKILAGKAADSEVQPDDVFGKAAGAGRQPDLVSPTARYSNAKSVVLYSHGRAGIKHPFGDRPVVLDTGRTLEYASQAEKALCGAWAKVHIARQLRMGHLVSDHDLSLFKMALRELDFCGDIATPDHPTGYYIGGRRLTEFEVKTVFGGAADASGGQNLVPQVLELEIIRGSLLNAELAPYVTEKTITKGTSVDVPTMVNLTVSSGTTEATAITAQSTSGLLSKLNSIFFSAVGMLQVGRDFLADITPNFMQEVTDSYSEQLGFWKDDQICNGDGTTEPLGIFGASGTTTVPQQSPSPTGWDITDVEALMFGINKVYRGNKGPSVRFVMNDVNYRKIRSLQLSTTDQRRLFGMSHEDYKLLERPVAIQNSIANTKAAFVDLSKYYLWRRQGMELRMTDQGDTLFKANSIDIVMRARYAGRLVLGEAMAQIITAPA